MIQHAGLGYRRDLAEDFLSLSDNSPIRFIEAAPENWLKMGGRARKQFDRVAERLPLALHGLSMSLGGQAPLDTDLIDGIKEMMRRYDCTAVIFTICCRCLSLMRWCNTRHAVSAKYRIGWAAVLLWKTPPTTCILRLPR